MKSQELLDCDENKEYSVLLCKLFYKASVVIFVIFEYQSSYLYLRVKIYSIFVTRISTRIYSNNIRIFILFLEISKISKKNYIIIKDFYNSLNITINNSSKFNLYY